jgi:effector-binding domain-containing protein
MPAYHVTRSIIINVPIAKVHESLIDYRQWPWWSPWLIMEPGTKIKYSTKQSQAGAGYDWDGEFTGKGEMKLREITENRLDMQLQFIKPFKSTAQVTFDLEKPRKNVTKVTWNMYSKLPFFLFWMVNKMKLYIGMDYERGLKMLKDYLETGVVPSVVKIEGISKLEKQYYVGIKNQCRIRDIGNVMPDDFQKLYHFMEENEISKDRIPFAIYETFDMQKDQTIFITAISVDSAMNVTSPFIKGLIDSCEVLKVTHTGSYEHLGNAWSTAMAFSRTKKIKTTKWPLGIEFYLNDPTIKADENLVTEVVLPLR